MIVEINSMMNIHGTIYSTIVQHFQIYWFLINISLHHTKFRSNIIQTVRNKTKSGVDFQMTHSLKFYFTCSVVRNSVKSTLQDQQEMQCFIFPITCVNQFGILSKRPWQLWFYSPNRFIYWIVWPCESLCVVSTQKLLNTFCNKIP